MTLAVIAIIISVVAVVFSGLLAILAFREQRLRLRPYVHIDRIDTNVTNESIIWRLGIKNVGLLPAKKVVISPSLHTETISKGLADDEQSSKAIILPQQIFWNRVGVKGETKQNIMQGKSNLRMDVSIIYEGIGKRFYFEAHYTYNSQTHSWTFEDGDAN